MPNVENVRFRWNVFIVELTKEEEIVKTRISELKGECEESANAQLSTIRKQRVEDKSNFQ